MNHTKEMWNEKADGWEKGLRENKKRQERSRRRVEATAQYLKECGVLNADTDVIDIGCGPGRFVAEFAKTARHCSGLDISDKMTDYGLAYCREQGVGNVSFYACDFMNMDIRKEGMLEKYDLVFSSITPAIGHREGYKKALEMSGKWFFNSNFISVTDSLQEKLVRMLGIKPVRSRDGAGFYCMLNDLILNGYYPEIRYYRESDTDEYDPESALEEYSQWFYRGGADEKQKKEMLEALHTLQDQEGKLISEKEWIYAWLLTGKKGRIVHPIDT